MKVFISNYVVKHNKTIFNTIHSNYHPFFVDSSKLVYKPLYNVYLFKNENDAFHFKKLLDINKIKYFTSV